MRRRNAHPQISQRFAAILEAETRVEHDVRFWLVHALHWHALLLAVICVVTFGYSLK